MKDELEKLQEKRESLTYTKDFHCKNCGNSFTKSFQFGQVASKGSCPTCGVSDAQLNRPGYREVEAWM